MRLRALLALLVAALVAAAAGTAAGTGSLAHRLATALRVPGLAPGLSTAMAFDLTTGKLVFARNADLSVEPASNEKLAVTYAALTELGPDYRFPTEVLGVGRKVGSTWHGRLVLKGFGDPSLTTERLGELAGLVRGLGIRRVTGGIVGDESWFDSERTAPGWLADFAGNESPPLSALVVDRAVRNGHLVDEPALAAAAIFDRQLKAHGVVARAASTGIASINAVPLVTVYSDPLSDVIAFMDQDSDNFTAEMVLKALGASGVGTGSTPAGAAVVRRDLATAGIPLQGVRIVDGSGLSRLDRVTGKELAALLVVMWNDPTLRPLVFASLARPGDGTLRNRFLTGPARLLVRAKTGTTDIASALSGYIGKRFAFVAIENGHPVNVWAAHTAQDAFATALVDVARSE